MLFSRTSLLAPRLMSCPRHCHYFLPWWIVIWKCKIKIKPSLPKMILSYLIIAIEIQTKMVPLSSCKAKKNLSSPKFLRSDCFITEVRKTLKQIYLNQCVCWYKWNTDQKGVLWLIINLVMNKERTKYTISTVITMFCFNVIGWGNRSYNKHCSRGDLI